MNNRKQTYAKSINIFFNKGYSTCTDVATAPFTCWEVPGGNLHERVPMNLPDIGLKLFLAIPVLIPMTVLTAAIAGVGASALGVGHLASLGVASVLDGNEQDEDTKGNAPVMSNL